MATWTCACYAPIIIDLIAWRCNYEHEKQTCMIDTNTFTYYIYSKVASDIRENWYCFNSSFNCFVDQAK
jgi:hypothetical protein